MASTGWKSVALLLAALFAGCCYCYERARAVQLTERPPESMRATAAEAPSWHAFGVCAWAGLIVSLATIVGILLEAIAVAP